MTLRMALAKAHRPPSTNESKRYQRYNFELDPHLSELSDPPQYAQTYHLAVSPEGLQPESIISREIGLQRRFTHGYVDIKLFNDKLYHLISEPLYFYNLQLTNQGSVDLKGAEIEYHTKLTPSTPLYWQLSYLDTETDQPLEYGLHAKIAGSLILSHRLTPLKTFSLGYVGNSRMAGYPYDKFFLAYHQTLTKNDQFRLSWGMTINYQNADSAFQDVLLMNSEISKLDEDFLGSAFIKIDID